MTLIILRLVFLCLCGLGSWSIFQLIPKWENRGVLSVLIGLAAGGAMVGIDKATKSFSVRGLTAGTFGLAMGCLMSYFVGNSVLFDKVDPATKLIAQIVMYLFFSYIAMVISLRGKDEFNIVIPYVKFRREEVPERLVLLDTNIIIDGRILDVASTGFLESIFIIPRFVLRELQYIADAADPIKRARGRRGLDVLKQLQRNTSVEVKIHDNEVPEVKEVDEKLIQLARMLGAEVLTNDYNLNHIAELYHVKVLNLHELTKALRPVVLPGEKLTIKLVKEGREAEQCVGYLEDGTMVVVSQARRLLDQEVTVIIESVLQTSAGRMAFAQLAPQEKQNPASR